MEKHKKRGIEILTGILVIMLYSSVSALIGLSSSYHEQYPATIAPGETKEIVFGKFQNTGDKDVTLKIELIEGEKIASIINENLNSFILPAGTRDNELKLKVSIPEGISEGYEYKISIKYSEVVSQEGTGMIQLTQSKTSSIPVVVKKPEEKPAAISITTFILAIFLILAILVIIYLLVNKRQISIRKIK